MKYPNKNQNSGGAMEIDEGPASEAEWEIWYQDLFDRESPRLVEISGRGLVNGLIELWRRHLFESVQEDGGKGFSRFNLWWKQMGRSIEVNGAWQGQMQLREWVFAGKGYGKLGNQSVLEKIAKAHQVIILQGKTGEEIVSFAREFNSWNEFEERLARLK